MMDIFSFITSFITDNTEQAVSEKRLFLSKLYINALWNKFVL